MLKEEKRGSHRDHRAHREKRGESRTDMAGKFLRGAKIFQPYFPSVNSSEFYERVRENLKVK